MSLIPFPLPRLFPINVAAAVKRQTQSLTTTLGRLGLNTVPYPSDPGAYEDDLNTVFVARREYPKDFSWIRVMDNKGSGLDHIPFQFMPKTITDNKQALYNDIQIIGRSSPFKTYSGSSARGISFTLDFYASPEQGMDDNTPKQIKRVIDRLQALVHPIYQKNVMNPPPRCLVHIGDQIEMVGVCKNVTVNYVNSTTPWTGSMRGGTYAFGASVALAFEEVQDIPLGYYARWQGENIGKLEEAALSNFSQENTVNMATASYGAVVPLDSAPEDALTPPLLPVAKTYTTKGAE